ncbi:MAG: alpha/beta hydrolase [Alphaproteobacteria bacterium]|nr:alpha/beta hydrolase [Alphaproteobacteria bacterium]
MRLVRGSRPALSGTMTAIVPKVTSMRLTFAIAALILLLPPSAMAGQLRFGVAAIGHGLVLHYAEEGAGPLVIFVHGSLSQMNYWQEQVPAFAARHYRAIAYSRRYNPPNHNPARAGYSAIADAQDLAAFIHTLHLGRVYVVGHSYGALTALYLAIRHPELLRAVVLAEPPAIPLLEDVTGPGRARARALYTDIQARMVEPMQKDFRAHHDAAGVAAFIDYVFADPTAWTHRFSAADRAEMLGNAHEWDVMMTDGTLFPPLSARDVAQIRVPVLVMSGAKSYPFLRIIDRYLAHHIPGAEAVTYANAGHQMWYTDARQARAATLAFFASHP